jgi:SulP family sulfate permease
MIAQGAANMASGLFSGIPAGGSVGQTALNVSLGAKSRWGGIFAGLWMLAIVLLIPGLVSRVPMAVLGALMVVAGFQAINFREAYSIWQTGGAARWSILVTLIATLILSVPVAVAVGVGLAILLFLVSAASDVRIVAVEKTESGRLAEVEPPRDLESETVTVLNIYGSLFFAGAKTLQDLLPGIGNARRPVVVLRMRGRTSVGATLIDMLDDYADDLSEAGGRLYLSGVHEDVVEQLRRAGKLEFGQDVTIHEATNLVGESTAEAVENANGWLGRTGARPEPMMIP